MPTRSACMWASNSQCDVLCLLFISFISPRRITPDEKLRNSYNKVYKLWPRFVDRPAHQNEPETVGLGWRDGWQIL